MICDYGDLPLDDAIREIGVGNGIRFGTYAEEDLRRIVREGTVESKRLARAELARREALAA